MDNLSTKISTPKLTLFAFHLLYNLTEGEEQPLENSDRLWQKCSQLGGQLNIRKLTLLPNQIPAPIASSSISPIYYRELLPEKLLNFSTIIPDKQLLQGEVYPVQIHDTYAMDLTLRYPYPDLVISQMQLLNPDGFFLPKNIGASLGQTLVLWVKTFPNQLINKKLADECVDAIFQQYREELQVYCQAQGTFLGSPIFEYNNDEEDPSNQCHLLVWFNSNYTTEQLEDAGDYYQPLINLLCCRWKILYVYYQSRQCNQEARKLYRLLTESINQMNERPSLNQLNDWLGEIPKIFLQYDRYIQDLEIHANTMEINLENYKKHLKDIANVSPSQDNINFLQDFGTLVSDIFVQQIKVDLKYLQASDRLFDRAIATIRGITEIEQTKSDRNIERNIAIFGFGIGAAGGVASASASYAGAIQEISTISHYLNLWQLNDTQSNLVITLNFSLFAGALASLITAGVIAAFKRWKNS